MNQDPMGRKGFGGGGGGSGPPFSGCNLKLDPLFRGSQNHASAPAMGHYDFPALCLFDPIP